MPSAAFPLGINLIQEGEYFYRIAEPEKALCDKLYTMPPVKNTKELAELLFQNLRIKKEELLKLDAKKIELLSNAYHATDVAKFETNLESPITEQMDLFRDGEELWRKYLFSPIESFY